MGFVRSLFSVFQDKRELLDPARFEDELACRIDWTPLVRGGDIFCTHRARLRTGLTTSILAFEVTRLLVVICGLVGVAGIVVCGVLLIERSTLDQFPVVMMLSPLVLVGLAVWMFWRARSNQIQFDRSAQQFTQRGCQFPLSDVRALQLLRERVRSSEDSYFSYELNLVFRDGHRRNVTDHGALKAIRDDAQMLAEYLQVPLWDAIDFRLPDHLQKPNLKLDLLRNNLGF